MTQFLPPNLLALFAPRDPIPYIPPVDKLPHEKKNRGYQGVGNFLQNFEDPNDTPPPTRVETREERLERRRRERAEQVAYKLEQEIALWDPHSEPAATTDPFKSLFVARINYDTSESKLRREFEVYGAIKKIVMTHDKKTGKPRGYAFIEYEHERDMHSAYKHADGKKIDGRRVLVDVERGRTVKGWLPRRLGGGLGGTRRGGPDVNIKHSGREDNERERERYAAREREREREREEERERRRGPSRDRGDRAAERTERPERRRSRSKDRERRKRSRSRDRKRRRSRSRDRDRAERDREKRGPPGPNDVEVEEIEEVARPPRERERERDRDRKRSRRSRSRDRKRRDRERDKDKDRRDRGGDYERGEGNDVRVKQEPPDDYPDYPAQNYEQPNSFEDIPVKYEEEDQKKRSEEVVNGRQNFDQYEDDDGY